MVAVDKRAKNESISLTPLLNPARAALHQKHNKRTPVHTMLKVG